MNRSERDNYLVPVEVMDVLRTLVRMYKLEMITSSRAREIMVKDLKLETIGYRTVDGLYREQWKLPTGETITFNKQFDSQIWNDINLIR